MNKQSDKWDYMHSTKGRIFSGVLIALAGLVLLLKQMGVYFPAWLFTWEAFIVLVGIYIGVKHNFKRISWLVLVLIGGILLVDDIYPETQLENYLWPSAIIVVGIVMITTAGRRKERWKHWREQCKAYSTTTAHTSENMLETVAIMAGVKKNVITKDFKGGEVTCVFGGSEINLSQADINGRVILEVNQIFGGTLLIIPSNWDVQSENIAILGGIEDKRTQTESAIDPTKILVLKGVTIFGGIDIKNY